MSASCSSIQSPGLRAVVTARDPGDWIDDQLADIRKKGAGVA